MKRGKLKRDLKWGETPWDDMTREELLLEVWRLYSALNESASVMALSKGPGGSPFWEGRGSGARALRMADAALAGLNDRDQYAEQVYRSFFRYAVDLLFSPGEGSGWFVCDRCGTMLGTGLDGSPPRGCITEGHRDAPMRPLEWRDLRPGWATP